MSLFVPAFNDFVFILQIICLLSILCCFCIQHFTTGKNEKEYSEKVKFRSQILVRPSIGEYWNTFGVPVLPENVIFTFFRMCWCYSEAYNTGTQKWFSIVQYSCTSIWDFKYTFSEYSWHVPAKKFIGLKQLV